MNYVFDVLLIVILFGLFGFVHSLLASNNVKRRLIDKIGDRIAFYRIAYNIFAVITFSLLYIYSPRPGVTIYDLPNPYDIIILVPQFLSLAVLLWSARYFNVKEFLGINQILRYFKKQYNVNELDEKMTLRIEGPYKYSRHPVYFYSILFLSFRPVMDLFYLTMLICIIAYFYIGSYYEEKKLIEIFGEVYVDYKKNVPGIFPVKFFQPYNPAEILPSEKE